ncbi:MAG: DNA helicase PcrA [Firmicutes bacterium]|nr:DNA helicase PcrA [Bacillota bacterium]
MEDKIETLLEGLNDRQKEAVTATEGPLLVLAGAGSGKTRVLVSRIAYILEKGYAKPLQILAITFTNKAANEMKERVIKLIGDKCGGMWIGTFHSMCARILRNCIDLIGYSRDFVIYDSADTKTLIKECIAELDLDEKNYSPRYVSSVISGAKNDMMDVEIFEREYRNDYRMGMVAKLYRLYQSKLKSSNALDFDDIILLTVKILSKNKDVLLKYQSMFEYVLVDEYQDTNNSQYMLINLLSGGYGNICVVGDEDQSIYGFRGANIDNILNFQKDYTDARVIKLEQNYRSTQNILNSANAVIHNNSERIGKTLWTDNGDGDKIIVHTSSNEYDEGRFVAGEVKKYYADNGAFGDCAVLYRTNAQSRVIEEMMMRSGIPYRVLAGLRFYDRKEIKDVIAYLRIVHNPSDDLSLKRVINEPKRKIGKVTVEKAQAIAAQSGSSVFDVISAADRYAELSSAAPRLKVFAALIKSFIDIKDTLPITDLVRKIVDDSGYRAALEEEKSVENQTRLDNIDEFMTVAGEFENNENYDGTLSEFLAGISLVSDIDSYDELEDTVSLMTIHSAKGLEFPVVFLVGLEEGLFPGTRSIGDEKALEEERRLCYVAITRAMKKLYITKTVSRTIFGRTEQSMESRFLKELPKEYISEEQDLPSAALEFAGGFGSFTPKSRKNDTAVKISSPSGERYTAGEYVEHKKFGVGQIISVQEFGDDAILQINFELVGMKQLMANFAKLKKIKA